MTDNSPQSPATEYRDDVLSGSLVFTDTRVPASTLFDYLRSGDTIDDFLADYPSVSRTQAERCLADAFRSMTQHPTNARSSG